MTPGVTITLIICGTVLILSIMSTITKIIGERASTRARMDRIAKTVKTLETPEMPKASDNEDYFQKF